MKQPRPHSNVHRYGRMRPPQHRLGPTKAVKREGAGDETLGGRG